MAVTEWIGRYALKEVRRVVGLISGTSVDAVDAVMVDLSGSGRDTRWQLRGHSQYPMPPALREVILSVSGGVEDDSSESVSVGGGAFESPGLAGIRCSDPGTLPAAGRMVVLNSAIGELFAEAALECIRDAEVPPGEIDLIASHGQTVCHLPEKTRWRGLSARGTLQLGDGAILAARTGLPVICDFRSADMAVGGQGAPLVPYADWVLFSKPGQVTAVQNLGGIGNVTYLPGIELEEVIAFDTGPANMLVDAAIRRFSNGAHAFDRNGAIARQGKSSPQLLEWLLDHPFLKKRPPKSTGHEEFGEPYLAEVLARSKRLNLNQEDTIATLTAVGAEAAVQAYHNFLPKGPDVVILCGGGSLNPVVVEHFRRLCPGASIQTLEEHGIPAQAKEALAFAILANETMLGRPSNVCRATGAARPAILGCLYLPPAG